MATYRLAQILITDPVDAAFAVNDSVIVQWNDVAAAIEVTLNSVSFTTAGTTLGNIGDNYQVVIGVSSSDSTYVTSGYSYCSSTSLHWFRMLRSYPEYPFFQKVITADSPVCAAGGGAVCDIQFVGAPTITHSTDRTTGGSISFEVSSSNGTIKYSLRDFDYATSGTIATAGVNTITNIIPGNWTLYAKDANDCTAIINFKILFKPAEAEHYRFSWETVPIGAGTSYYARLRIYEREYPGDVVEIDRGDESPFSLHKPRVSGHLNDKFYPIHPTSATLSLYSQQDYQFLPLFTQDNKRYRCVYEVDEGSGFTQVWQGFIIPSVYREDFISTPYTVEIQITDNVRTLEEEPFTDDDGNLLFGDMKLIKVISHIMKKTGLNLSIRSGINIFETNHTTTASSDPLDQTYIDASCYREGKEPFSCWRVLESILRPFAARIYQYDNQWIIEETDRAIASYAYRVFTSEGVYSSNSTFNPLIDVKASSELNRAAMVDEDQSLEVVPAYGKIDIVSKLNYIGSIVAGGFEKEDLLSPEPETFIVSQGVYKSEENFKGWTLRQPAGVSGVNFGRVVVGNRGDVSMVGNQFLIVRVGKRGGGGTGTAPTGTVYIDDDLTRSVGAFYYAPNSWGGNLRNAYIESDAKPYQYGPGDELNFRFEYSTPANAEYPFMVLRFMIKLGSTYLQQDRTWGASEYIYRAYPPVTNSLQKFELSVALPSTDVTVDTTIQVRIYFYASEFYDHGLPPNDATGDTDGTDGRTSLDGLLTASIDYDYRLDLRVHETVGSVSAYWRGFFELVRLVASEDLSAGLLHAGDYNATTNPYIWRRIRGIQEKGTTSNRRGLDRKFYLDNVALDALINGQPPPREQTVSLTVSKYINENLEVELYNFDLPDIVNGKNMYNNYFRLSSGTPTALWKRTGIAESLPLQQILLKVLGGNHSAPTFRVTGTFINEFDRIGINNFLRITKPGSSLSASNTEFTSNLDGWTGDGSGTAFAWTADNSGSAQVTLTGAVEGSERRTQEISHNGGYVEFTVNVKAVPTLSTNNSEDVLWVLFYNGSALFHAEKMQTFVAVTSDSTFDFTYTAFAPGQVTKVGFYIKRVTGTGEVKYQISKFAPAGNDVQEVYQITDYSSNERMNEYFLELMQVSKTYVSLAGIDTGGNNQGGGSDTGSSFNGDFNADFGSDFDTTLN